MFLIEWSDAENVLGRAAELYMPKSSFNDTYAENISTFLSLTQGFE